MPTQGIGGSNPARGTSDPEIEPLDYGFAIAPFCNDQCLLGGWTEVELSAVDPLAGA